ncbi:MAG: cytochrome c3 family protein [Oscillatoria sp. PMC 1068.18]|nr:cytochrome c3 family protein [Oscillatoria sp. PMC 1076.18]MEC4988139.1 cytochrome c3 family protein [Oscillatoria sp. PMC 1068.18]
MRKRVVIVFTLLLTITFLLVNIIFSGEKGYNSVVLAQTSQAELTEINQLWQDSAHALAEVNCSSCHLDEETKELLVKPSYESCQSCHEAQVETFLLGKHGIRIAEGLDPLTPAIAHLPMKDSALDKQMTCNTCHNVHSVNTIQASVDACLTCHNDNHSLNYERSQHAKLFFAVEDTLTRPNSESVTCATCHLPRQEFGSKIHVNHNNTYTLLPRDRLVKEVCMNCHGMEYSYNSIFDEELIEGNFHHQPTKDLETLELVRLREEKRTSK